jgi:hypothetical protein
MSEVTIRTNSESEVKKSELEENPRLSLQVLPIKVIKFEEMNDDEWNLFKTLTKA